MNEEELQKLQSAYLFTNDSVTKDELFFALYDRAIRQLKTLCRSLGIYITTEELNECTCDVVLDLFESLPHSSYSFMIWQTSFNILKDRRRSLYPKSSKHYHTSETKHKIAESRRGKKHTIETREKISKSITEYWRTRA